MDINKIIRSQSRSVSKLIKGQEKFVKKSIRKIGNLKVKQLISKEGRVRIDEKRRKEVMEKYNRKCAKCKKKLFGITLQIHHKNGRNSDNGLFNLELLCPNHHYQKHTKGSKLNKIIRKRSKKSPLL